MPAVDKGYESSFAFFVERFQSSMLAFFYNNNVIMARPIKQGLDYFSLDVDFFSDMSADEFIKWMKLNK